MNRQTLKPEGVRRTAWHGIVPSSPPSSLAALLLLLGVATTLRLSGALNSLWLDEIWSLDLAATVRSPLDVFTSLHHENNHYLNTLFLYLAGNHGDWPGYRLPSLLAGTGSVFMAWLIGMRRSLADAFFTLATITFSYVLILYSSEARGYATVVFCAFLAYYLLERYLEEQRPGTAMLFSLVTVLGLMSHLMFVAFLCPAFFLSCWRLTRDRIASRRIIAGLTALFGLPLSFSLLLYWVDIRKITEGGGDQVRLYEAFRNALAWVLGTTPATAVTWMSALAALVILAAGILLLWRKQRDLALFYLSVILIFPLLLALFRGSTALYVRHFLIAIAFLQLLWGFVLAEIFRSSQAGRIISCVLLACYLIPNCWHTSTLLRYGRGDYREAISFMATVSSGEKVTIGSDHEFRIGTVLKFQDQRLLRGKKLHDFGEQGWPAGGPEWFISHKESYEDPSPPGLEISDSEGNRYGLVKTLPTAPLTGLYWYIYHNGRMTIN